MGQVKVTAVMTAARCEITYARNQIELALKTLGIPLTVSGGVFYGQCMQKMFERTCETDCDYVVTIDGDTIFTAKQLERLIGIVDQEQQIDALAGLQLRRGKADLLGFVKGKRELQWSGYPLRVDSAHFGLTVISVEKLRATAKPWFFSQPNSEGRWEDEKIDDDVWFWKQWREAGHSIYLDPGTRIGHLEEMIAVFDPDLRPRHVYPADWNEANDS